MADARPSGPGLVSTPAPKRNTAKQVRWREGMPLPEATEKPKKTRQARAAMKKKADRKKAKEAVKAAVENAVKEVESEEVRATFPERP